MLQKALWAESEGLGSIPALPVNVWVTVVKSSFVSLNQSLTPKMVSLNQMISKAQSNYKSSTALRNTRRCY